MDYQPSRLRPHRRQHWGVEPDPDLGAQLDDPSVAGLPPDRRRVLWRDSATILMGIILALLALQVLAPRSSAPIAGDPSSQPTELTVVILTARPRSVPPVETFGPVIDPSLGIDATPTPIPVITLGPTEEPTDTPEPTASPSASPKITPKPTRTPRPTQPPPTPTPTPPPTPAPPNAGFAWTQVLPLTVEFTNTSSGDTSWSWDFGDGDASSQQNPTHVYAAPGDYVVQLTVGGPGGTDAVTHTITVTAL
jgi:hypothetical protein